MACSITGEGAGGGGTVVEATAVDGAAVALIGDGSEVLIPTDSGGRRTGFYLEPLSNIGLRTQPGMQQLDSHGAIQPGVPTVPHFGHPAETKNVS